MNTKTPIQADDTQQVDPLPPEVAAFCALLARIMHRCMVEQDARVLAILGLSNTEVMCCAPEQKSEVSHGQAA